MNLAKPEKRLSMNTSLKNARIFDEEAWQEGENGSQIKKEVHDNDAPENSGVLIKQEKMDSSFAHFLVKENVKNETECERFIKNEPSEKHEQKGETSFRDTKTNNACALSSTPLSESTNVSKLAKVKEEPLDLFNESPFNKQIFNTLKIKDPTPIKDDLNNIESPDLREELNNKRSLRKSVKRTIFTRNSPYKRNMDEPDTIPKQLLSVKTRLGPKMDESNIPFQKNKSQKEHETDPATLERRQKQIEYGKNTTGYDTYTSTVPKHERKKGDPQTPDKYSKYSRRGWEGLIKQWRIKLHKYDPVDT